MGMWDAYLRYSEWLARKMVALPFPEWLTKLSYGIGHTLNNAFQLTQDESTGRRYIMLYFLVLTLGMVLLIAHQIGALSPVKLKETWIGPWVFIYKEVTGPYKKTAKVMDEVMNDYREWYNNEDALRRSRREGETEEEAAELRAAELAETDPDTDKFGLYFDNPREVKNPGRLRSLAGVAVNLNAIELKREARENKVTVEEVLEDMRKLHRRPAYIKEKGYKVRALGMTKVTKVDFPIFWLPVSAFLGMLKVYPRLAPEAQRVMKTPGIFEFYCTHPDKNVIVYAVPHEERKSMTPFAIPVEHHEGEQMESRKDR
ncbi:unnamed protein product [Pedinophyceae sp. YPF-701]|nr:unnamed protein product [Pedinophyceae sp. YPF-701]